MTAITLALDFGASFLRAIMTGDSFKPELFLIEPQVTRVTSSSISDYNNFKIGSSDIVKSSWIEYENQFYAIGNLAKNRFQGSLQLEKRKFELAVPKVLAVVGAISEIHQLPNDTALNLGVVLPYGEFRDRDLFKQILTSALQAFKFCSLEKSFKLDMFICLPEGGGVLTQGRPAGTSFQDLELIVLMIGFRDVSVLFVDRGEMSKGLTAPLGFFNLCKSVAEKTSLCDYQRLTSAICKAGKNINPKALLPLISNVGESYREYELTKITKAIIEAREEYWLMLSQWLKPQIKTTSDEVIVAGGTANFLRPEINSFLNFTRVLWCDELEKRINSSFCEQIKTNSLQYRLADVYGLFFYLHSQLSQK